MTTAPRPTFSDPAGEAEAWSWLDALATARPGQRYRIERLLFSLVRDRCRRQGLDEGEAITCLENRGSHRHLVLRRMDGETVELEREYAWFVQVRPSVARSRPTS